ncbi:hypothetical protein BpHYR1_016624 [Brachionus plicatilis]|uniref:Uncharacterized protein n=1 Tax=Brachionus plicatilis TaxID=10195 RepID=A0A3M7SKW0_BRAPC|nr:hypothetical protein BpHYR1_016624 [Brachionus plicatilis]
MLEKISWNFPTFFYQINIASITHLHFVINLDELASNELNCFCLDLKQHGVLKTICDFGKIFNTISKTGELKLSTIDLSTHEPMRLRKKENIIYQLTK